MKKKFRLTDSADFKKVLDQRHNAGKNDSVSIFYSKNDLTHTRIGISVSTKVGNAIVRARIRRQIRAQINDCEGILKFPFDIVIIARPGYIKKSYQDNSEIIQSFLKNLSFSPKEEKA